MATSSKFYAYLSILFVAQVMAQSVTPSNSTRLEPASYYPRFNVNASGSHPVSRFPSFQIAPLGPYAMVARQCFLNLNLGGRIVETNAGNAQDIRTTDIAYISCDAADYDNSNLGPAEIVNLLGGTNLRNSIIFYTREGNHCEVSGLPNDWIRTVNGIFTTIDPVVAGQVADLNLSREVGAQAVIRPDQDSYTNSSAPGWSSDSAACGAGPTTAVAMIILYSITGVITAMFLLIIVTGAIRARRHPERYGPRRGDHARGRQSRAKGIARAVLETIPIVKFGDNQKADPRKSPDVEMPARSPVPKSVTATVSETTAAATVPQASSASTSTTPGNADGSDESGSLGCSICTEDFQKGEEVRMLPCNHKFHPECVDPWLLNVSGTCPLCRVDLRASVVAEDSAGMEETSSPWGHPSSNTNTIQGLRAALSLPREERIAALQRFRIERRMRNQTTTPPSAVIGTSPPSTMAMGTSAVEEEERRGLAHRLMTRFKVRTRTHQGGSDGGEEGRHTRTS